MADTTALKNRIRAAIKANDNQEITGSVLQQALLDIVDELDLNPELENEAQQRQNGDSTLQQGINTERQARIDADNALGQRITQETQRAQEAEQAADTKASKALHDINNLEIKDVTGSQSQVTEMSIALRTNEGTQAEPEYVILAQLLIHSASSQKAGLMSADMRNLLYNIGEAMPSDSGSNEVLVLSKTNLSTTVTNNDAYVSRINVNLIQDSWFRLSKVKYRSAGSTSINIWLCAMNNGDTEPVLIKDYGSFTVAASGETIINIPSGEIFDKSRYDKWFVGIKHNGPFYYTSQQGIETYRYRNGAWSYVGSICFDADFYISDIQIVNIVDFVANYIANCQPLLQVENDVLELQSELISCTKIVFSSDKNINHFLPNIYTSVQGVVLVGIMKYTSGGVVAIALYDSLEGGLSHQVARINVPIANLKDGVYSNSDGTFKVFLDHSSELINNNLYSGETLSNIYSLEHQFLINFYNSSKDVSDLKVRVNNLEERLTFIEESQQSEDTKIEASFRYDYISLYKTNSFTDWLNWKAGSQQATDWTIDSNGATPTSYSTFESKARNGVLYLNKHYQSAWKKAVFDVILYSDTVLDIHFARQQSTGGYPNESLYQIDCANSALKVMALSNRDVTYTVFKSKTLDFTIVNGRKYRCEVSMEDVNFKFALTDMITAETTILTFSNTWDAGTQKEIYGFGWKAGVTAPTITYFEIFEPRNPLVCFLGDSITEGYGMQSNFMNKFASVAIRSLLKNSIVCAASSDTISNILTAINDELSTIRPKYAIITIGTNDGEGVTSDAYLNIKTALENINCIPIFNHIPANNYAGHSAVVVNGKIDAAGVFNGAYLDVATSINNNPSSGVNTSMFVDGIHPNQNGTIAILKRFMSDLQFLFNPDLISKYWENNNA